ncbi:MAG: HAD-IC family P-type ATPase [Actinomycetota bacterium]
MTDAPADLDPERGLSADEVAARIADGRVNLVPGAPTRTFSQIVRANVLTPVNGIIGVLFVLIMIAAPGADALFAGVVVSNSVLGIAQEVRAKRTLDRLAVLAAPRARVRRDGEVVEVAVDEVVADDLILLEPGDQAVVDAEVLDARGLELDESLLTGESDPVNKEPGDQVLSGSFVAASSGACRATRIGGASYAAELAEEARRFQLVNSELKNGINLILRWLTWIIPPVSLVLAWSLWQVEPWREALRGTVAAAVAMVPDGLVLLTSISMIVGVLSLARRKALARELASVELLARVDVLCLDKTGTITTGRITFAELELVDEADGDAPVALAALAASDPAPNATLLAIAEAFPSDPGWTVDSAVPFSSARKWASTTFAGHGTWLLGAPEMLLDDDDPLRDVVAAHAAVGRRVILLASSTEEIVDERRPAVISPRAFVLLEDEVRPDAPEILGYLRSQGIALKVISGDHPTTVAAVARRAGIEPGEERDARELPEEGDEIRDAMGSTTVFGRVTPHQKRAMVGALQADEHVVAMTGDGVNDVLALKDADMGIAMGSGSSASRAVAQLVLLDDAFSTFPRALAEGRRVINNIERIANLFIVKATYAVLLAAIVGITQVPFPFLPRHLTLVGSISIGIPGFVLSLYSSNRRARTGFIERAVRYSLPAGAIAATVTYVVYEVLRRDDDVSLAEARTGATLMLLAIGLVVLAQLARPLIASKIALIGAMAASYLVALNVSWLAEYFQLFMPPTDTWWLLAAAFGIAAIALLVGPRLVPSWGAAVAADPIEPAERDAASTSPAP